MNHTRLLVLLAALALVAAACGDDKKNNNTTDTTDTAGDSSTDGTSDGTADTPNDNGPDTVGGCTHNGMTAALQIGAYSSDENGEFHNVFIQDGEDPGYNAVSVELYAGGMPGGITLTNENYATCNDCVVAFRGCNDDTGECQQAFLAYEGTLDISSIGMIGDQFTGTLTDVRMQEVTIDPDNSFTSTPVPGGEQWCLDSLSFDAELEGDVIPEPMCDPMQPPFVTATQECEFNAMSEFGSLLYYQARTSDMFPNDWLSVEIFQDFSSVTMPGTYPIEYVDYENCANCIVVSTGCTDATTCAKSFLAVSGEIEVTTVGMMGNFTGTLRNIELFEHTFMDGASEIVEGGDSFCISELAFDSPITTVTP